jgi:hypothetical protein
VAVRRILLGALAVVLAVSLVGIVAVVVDLDREEARQRQEDKERAALDREHMRQFVREMNDWSLPPSIARADTPDEKLGSYVARHFVAEPGFTTRQAAEDLVAFFDTKGYRMAGRRGYWAGECKVVDCIFFVDIHGDDIEVGGP